MTEYTLKAEGPDAFSVWKGEELVARIAQTMGGKWKIVGDDVYAKSIDELIARLHRRGDEWRPAACPDDERDREDNARRDDARDGYDDE